MTSPKTNGDRIGDLVRCDSVNCFNEDMEVYENFIKPKFCISYKKNCLKEVNRISNLNNLFASYIYELSKTNFKKSKEELLVFLNENYVRDNLNQNYDGLVCEVVDKDGCLNPEEFIELDNPEKTGTCLAKVGFCIVDYPN